LEIYALYRKDLGKTPGLGFQPAAPWAEVAPWLFCITVNKKAFGKGRDEVMQQLDKQGIDTRPFFIPLHSLPPFREESRRRQDVLPVTMKLAAEGINLPTYNAIKDEEILYVTNTIRELARR
jgi:perosamine synthetase